MDIKVGEYVRTKGGYIAKVLSVVERNSIISNLSGRKVSYQPRYWIDNKSGSITKSYIVNHSFNIIDLIEVGDYVNGRLVLQVNYKNKNVCLLIPFTDTQANTNICWYGYEYIKTIVTKEQFEYEKYIVGK